MYLAESVFRLPCPVKKNKTIIKRKMKDKSKAPPESFIPPTELGLWIKAGERG